MRKKPLQVRVKLEARLNPSEDPAKLARAIVNILGERYSDRITMGGGYVRAEAEGLDALAVIYEQIRSRRTMAVLRRLLLRARRDNSSHVYINRQAAYVGLVVFAETEEESPLGPIRLELESNDINELIEWLVPRKEISRG